MIVPAKPTPELTAKFAEIVGMTPANLFVAAKILSVPRGKVERWMAEGSEPDGDPACVAFRDAIERANAHGTIDGIAMIQRHADGGNEACSAWLRRHRDRLLAKVPPHLLTMKPAEPPRRRAKRTPGEGGVNGNARRPS